MFTRTVSKALLASAAAGLVTFAVAPAHAEIGAPRSMLVRYSDLDLQSDAGKTRLQKRIAFAAETVCGPADGLSYFSRQATAACEENAIANASRGMVQVFAQAGGGTLRVSAN
jgi:UrcA family protein